ncbi:MAG: hypothetical protein LBQ60_13625 [Bacteroidales bacterium]|nr:hypothetical protein [Bacteroidales bacterium]
MIIKILGLPLVNSCETRNGSGSNDGNRLSGLNAAYSQSEFRLQMYIQEEENKEDTIFVLAN